MAPKPKLVDDPNVFIPPAVRRHAKQADALFRAARGDPAEPGEVTPPAEPPAEPVAPTPPPEQPTPQPVPPAPPVTPPQPVPPQARDPRTFAPVEPPPAPQPPPEEDWERRYRSMEGRYKRAENDILSMSSQLASMQNLIASMNARPVTQETPPELRPQSFLTPEERSEYGDEFLGVVAKKAKEEFSPEVQALRAQLDRLENQFKGNAEQVRAQATMALEATLDAKLPIWRDINVMPEFHAWLALPDMYSGAIKHELLRAAYAQGNSPRVLSFFKGFLDQEAALVPRMEETHPAEQPSGKVPLETFAAPGRAKTAAASPAPAEKPIITRAQISQFYAESASGKWRGREAEKARLEAMIFEAEREGRIR